MPDPQLDEYWMAAAGFVGERTRPGDRVLAPEFLLHRFPGAWRYIDTFQRPSADYDWAIVHKGEVASLSPTAVDRLARGRAVFANEVFVVWHKGKRYAAIDDDSPHLLAFYDILDRLRRSGTTPPPRPAAGRDMRTVSDMLFEVGLAKGRYSDPLSLIPSQSQVYSQNGEDGIVAEIFSRIGSGGRFFVEIGIEDGRQNNTRLLLEQGWRGVWVDGSAQGIAEARTAFGDWIRSGALAIVEATVTRDNIDAVLDRGRVPPRFDFLSIDVDQNTGHLWAALRRRARVACVEYNANLPPAVALQAAYDPAQTWDGTSWYGASLKALEGIAAAKEMSLVGCELMGVNAFFVEMTEAAGKFRAPFTAQEHYEPPRYGGDRSGHRPSPQARRWSAG